MPTEDCLFCKIVAGDVPADVVHETDTTVAFRDIEPQAPTHVLVIPRSHHANAAELAAAEPGVLVDLVSAAKAVADQNGLGEGYRLVFNTGPQAHQTVFHAHLHLLGGRSMGWPPG
jgi:histidine triad (HIT) family protein